MAESVGCILRITAEEWVEQVFSTAVYYANLRRKWRRGQTMIFLHKTEFGDAVVGYGVIQNTYEKDEFSETERKQCQIHDWNKALEFSYVIRFKKPLLIKDTFFKGSKLRGRYFHGYALNEEQMKDIITQAERLQSEASC